MRKDKEKEFERRYSKRIFGSNNRESDENTNPDHDSSKLKEQGTDR